MGLTSFGGIELLAKGPACLAGSRGNITNGHKLKRQLGIRPPKAVAKGGESAAPSANLAHLRQHLHLPDD